MAIQANKKSSAIQINEEFKTLLVPLSHEEKHLLKEDILENGCLNPIVVWNDGDKNILIDGHNRYGICTEFGISYKIEFMQFNDHNEVRIWIINNQLGRRNLTPDQLSYYRGLQYLQSKKSKGGYQNVLSKGQGDVTTSELIAAKFHVSPSTIKRDSNYAKGVDIIGKSNPKLKLKLLTGESELKKKDIQLLGESVEQISVKNEADLFNKIEQIKRESLDKVESELNSITIEEQSRMEVVENPFGAYEDRIKRIKGQILSYINKAIDHKDLEAIVKLKGLIERLEYLIKNE